MGGNRGSDRSHIAEKRVNENPILGTDSKGAAFIIISIFIADEHVECLCVKD
jgi:hypothetical protein